MEENNLVEFSDLFSKIGNENASSAMLSENLLLAFISQLYIETARLFSEEKIIGIQNANTSYIQHYQHFEELLEQNFIKEKSAFQYAERLNLTTKHLNRITQTVVQKTVSEIITERTILEAKRMLIYLDESLVDIAFRLGYEEYSYFVRVFRKKTG